MDVYWGSGGIVPLIVTLAGDGGEGSASRSGRFYPQGKSAWYPLDRRAGEPQSCSGWGGEENIPSPCQESNPRTSIIQSIAQHYTNCA
jgi:hypothetical protein